MLAVAGAVCFFVTVIVVSKLFSGIRRFSLNVFEFSLSPRYDTKAEEKSQSEKHTHRHAQTFNRNQDEDDDEGKEKGEEEEEVAE